MKLSRHRWFLLLLLLASHLLAYFAIGSLLAPRAPDHAAPAASAGQGTTGAAKAGNRSASERAVRLRMLDELLARDLPEAELEKACSLLWRDWIKHDLGSAMDLFYSPLSPGRYRSLLSESELDEEMSRQAPAVWQWIRSGRFGSNRASVTDRWIDALKHYDGPRESIAQAVIEGIPKEQRDAMYSFCRNANAQELVQAREWLSGAVKDHDSWDWLASRYAERKVELAAGNVDLVFAAELDPRVRESLCSEWLEREAKGLPPEELALHIGKLPPDLIAAAMERLHEMGSREEMPELVAMVNAAHESSLWDSLGDQQSQEILDDWVRSLCNEYIDPLESFTHLAGISDPGLRARALASLGSRAIYEWKGGVSYFDSIPDGPDRDSFLAGFLTTIYENDDEDRVPEGLDHALSLVSDPQVRAKITASKNPPEAEPGTEE